MRNRILAVVLATVLVSGLVPIGTASPQQGAKTPVEVPDPETMDPVDDATLGERSNQSICTTDTTCAEATLENAHWRCSGTNATTFHCNVTYYLNVTVHSPQPGVCANASVNITSELAPEVCTDPLTPAVHETSGPVTLTYDAGASERILNATAELCLETSASTTCETWRHDPILLPTWEQWRNPEPGGPGWDHRVCVGDSAALSEPGDPAPGCSSAIANPSHSCTPTGAYNCTVTVDLYLASEQWGLCGSLSTEYGESSSLEVCTFRHEQASRRDGNESLGPVTARFDEVSRFYSEEEIPWDGRVAVVEVELCVWSFRPGATKYCDSFNKTEEVPAHPCVCYPPLIGLQREAYMAYNYTATTIEHTGVPASVHP